MHGQRWGHHLATLVQLWFAVPFLKVCTSLSATSTSPHRRSSWVSSPTLYLLKSNLQVDHLVKVYPDQRIPAMELFSHSLVIIRVTRVGSDTTFRGL